MSEKYPLKRLCDVGVSLLDCVHNTPKPKKSGYPYIAIPNIQKGVLDLTNVRLISEEDYLKWTKKIKPQTGDIILTRRARVGDTAVVPDGLECAIGQNLVILRSDGQQLSQNYLRWVLRSPNYWEQVAKYLNRGAVFDSLNCREIPLFELPVPSLEIQNKIADVLSSLDDKIELNTRMNTVLEEIARALFHRWFVEFEFPNADGKPYQSAGGKMVDSEMGSVPEGWEVGTIEEVVQILGGSTPDTKNSIFWENGENPFCTPKDLSNLISPILLDTERHITEEGVQSISSKRLPAGTLLLSSRAPVGYIAISSVNVSVNQGFIAMICNEEISNVFLLQWLRKNMGIIKGRANGSTFQEISKRNFRTIPFLIPSADVLTQYNSIVKPLFNRITTLTKESVEISGVRNTLLPKLMSGEIEF